MNRNLGIIMIIIGAAMLIWSGFSYTKKEKVVDLGPLHVDMDKRHDVSWPPYLGTIVLVGGIVIVAFSRKSR